MLGRERIAITGLGVVSALGSSSEQTFQRACAGERGFVPVDLFDTSGLRSSLAGQVLGLDVAAIAPRGEAADWSRSDALALLAAREALTAARAPATEPLGLVLGGTTGGMYETERALAALPAGSIEPRDARRLLDFPLSVSVERVARVLGSVVHSATVCSACSSGAVALALGASWLLSGRMGRVLAGGVDGLCQLTFTGFSALGAMDAEPCRPFDVSRAGLTLGEGAGCLVLELESSARQRGAEIIGFLSGWALGSEAHHITHPEPSGARASTLITDALRSAGLAPSDIDYVNAHGTGTVQNDAMEALALQRALGPDASRIWVSSSKAQIGHTLGAAGAIEAALSVLSIQRGALLPTVGLVEPAAPSLRHVRAPNQKSALRAALSCSFGFGGACAVLAFEAPDAEKRVLPAPQRGSVVVSGAASYGPLGLLTGAASARYLEADTFAEAELDPLTLLDAERSRRFGRASACLVATAEGALQSAAVTPAGTGLVVGSAFGDVTRSVQFLQKLFDRGPKFASPAEFPQLVASTGSGNASLYLGLTGPCLTVSEFATSGENAVSVALALLELDPASACLAGAVEARDAIVAAVLGGGPRRRSEGGGFVVLEDEGVARARGATPLARLLTHFALRGEFDAGLSRLGAPLAESLLITTPLPVEVEAALARSAWSGVPRRDVSSKIGFHEAIGATALACAVAQIAAEKCRLALVVTSDRGLLYLSLLGAPEEAS